MNSKFKIQNSKLRKGSVLLLSLLILSSVLAASTAVGTLVVRAIRSNRELNDAVVVYAAAESGLEKGLWQASQEPSPAGVAVARDDTAIFSNTASVQVHTTNRGDHITLPFFSEGFVQRIDLYNPVDFSAEKPGASVSTVHWDSQEGQAVLACALWDGTRFVSCGGIETTAGSIAGLDPLKAYRFTVSSADASPVRGFRLEARDDRGNVRIIPTALTIAAIGSLTTSRQALQVTFPATSPLPK